MNTKVCKECSIEKSVDQYKIHSVAKSGKIYYRGSCIDCQNLYQKRYRENNKEKISAKNKRWSEENKEYRSKYNKDYRERNLEVLRTKEREYYHNNREKCIEARRRYYSENRCQVLARSKEYRQNNPHIRKAYLEKNGDTLAEKGKEYRKRTSDKRAEYRKRTKEYRSEYSRKWYKENKDRSRDKQRRYRAGKNEAFVSDVSFEYLLDRDGPGCSYCLEIPDQYHLDHVFPLYTGGLHSPDNLVLACESCNKQKSWLDPEEYLARRARKIGPVIPKSGVVNALVLSLSEETSHLVIKTT